ncbi:DNA recombination protein RmuC [Sedimentitalea arenosa]|jgi:DNA recombination protein RmuC|uniref:DNA recombination protein RmuC homolog n=1 Tax=Sedimentitalea arenosa TaxID=2798803 RepID=A0A8J7J7H0_9RHOB|nr:DNA recombination protein RmuC [Arenibacterium arenosum]MBJ6372815.1 DNA recombination protein RmuC [Arenibacterium arenosum]
MIRIGDTTLALDDPLVLGAAGLILLVLILLILAVRAAGRSARMAEPLSQQLSLLGQHVQQLGAGQEQLRGGLQSVSETQANAQMQLIQTVESRLSDVQQHMNDRLADNMMRQNRALTEMQERMKETLHGSSKQTATSLTQLQERLATIDKAQDNITKLSGDVLSLQDILSNKQTRGAFGEIQLNDIVSKALPSDSYALQVTLSNGKRADCLIHLPNPPGPIVIDSKFPLEAYEALRAAQTDHELRQAATQMRTAVRTHIKAISERYIIEGETADGALMFLPSEAVYAELHANFPEVVREGFAARVWIVSPTTCMATLNTMRAILKDARMREQAGAIRKALKQLHRDVEIIGERAGKLDTHLRQAGEDVSGILVASERAGKRADRLDNFDFEELAPDDPGQVVALGGSKR